MPVYKVHGQQDVMAAFKKGSAWGTELELGAGNGVLVKSLTLGKTRPDASDPAIGTQFEEYSDLGNIEAPVSLGADMRYDGLLNMLAQVFGTAGVPAQQAATAAYKHQLQLAADRYGIFGVLGANYKANIFSNPSVKWTGFTLKGPDKEGMVELELRGVAFDLLHASAVNTVATFVNVTIPYKGHRVLFRQGVFRINAQGGAALASPTDVVKVKSFELTYDAPALGEYTSEFGHRIDQPTDDGRPVATLKLDFARYDDAGKLRLDAFDAETIYKGDITFTGANIATTYDRKLIVRMPQMKLERPVQDWAEGTIPQAVTYKLQKAQVAPGGMETADIGINLVAPLMMELINTQTTNPLA